MRNTLRQFAIALALASVAGGVTAAPHDDDDRRGHTRYYHADWRHHDDDYRKYERKWQREQRAEMRRRIEWERRRDRELQRRYAYGDAYRAGYRDASRWQRGHRYYGQQYVIRDYDHYHLRRPPYGHHWVKADGKYLLVAIATGLILDIATR